ncbi:MAG: aldehyde dehydrogenase family protein [Pseudomonadota bacterium]
MNIQTPITGGNQAHLQISPQEATEKDLAAIQKLDRDFAAQKAAFLKDQYPSLETRVERVLKIRDLFAKHFKDIRAAVRADYGVHPSPSADLFETAGPIARAEAVAAHLEQWMTPKKRTGLSPLSGDSVGYVRWEPKGVIGNMSPWNFPFEIALGPAIEMLAAGNRVIIKPSEVTAHCSETLAAIIPDFFEPEVVTTAVGGIPLAEHFSTLRWDHLLYTGNSTIGRRVMANAARNLVPVTLELGGKAPAIFDRDRIDKDAVRKMLGLKATKRGQVCLNVDYCLVHEDDLDAFVELVQADDAHGLSPNNFREHSCAIVSERHLARAERMLAEAKDGGATIITLGQDDYQEDRCMPLKLVLNAPEGSALMTQEIFGPILPIVPYKSLDDALARVNAQENALALYIFSNDDGFVRKVMDNTRSGGVSVNCCGGQVQGELPFGGIGESGMGVHHGEEGFHEFSNPRAIMELKNAPAFDAMLAPYGDVTKHMIGEMFGPENVE